MILYRVQHAETGAGPFSVITARTSSLWEEGPTPLTEERERLQDWYARVVMDGKVCGVHRPRLLPKWFPEPLRIRAYGLVLTVWDVPDDHCRTWKFQAVFNRDAATLLRTIPLPERWEDVLDILERLTEN